MIVGREVVLVGRWEHRGDQPPRDLAAWEEAQRIMERAEAAYATRWPDKPERWLRWNALAMLGRFGSWSTFEFQRYHRLGSEAFPYLMGRLRYDLSTGLIDPVPVPSDPPILHDSYKVLPSDWLPPHVNNPKHDVGWLERYRRMCRQIEHLTRRRGAGTVKGWRSILEREGIEIVRNQHGFSICTCGDVA